MTGVGYTEWNDVDVPVIHPFSAKEECRDRRAAVVPAQERVPEQGCGSPTCKVPGAESPYGELLQQAGVHAGKGC